MFDAVIEQLLHRPADSHKFTFGHVLIIGGSPGMVGAPLLAGRAALRSGAGLVTIASIEEVIDNIEGKVLELMTHRLPDAPDEAATSLEEFTKRRSVTVLVIGCGMAASEDDARMVARLLRQSHLPMIIDGGALTALKDDTPLLATSASSGIVLTPHPGEFKRLLGSELPDGRDKMEPLASKFATEHSVTVVLKGHPTYVCGSGGSLYENATGNAGLATAGTGDVLAGMVAAMVAQRLAPEEAARVAVYLHGRAGELAAETKTQPGVIASDVIDAIPEALKSAGAERGI